MTVSLQWGTDREEGMKREPNRPSPQVQGTPGKRLEKQKRKIKDIDCHSVGNNFRLVLTGGGLGVSRT